MAQRGESGWQTEKTVIECMRYILENEIATDVIFEVGPPDGATVDILAHKMILISRSEVFEAMFSSGMTESTSSRVRVEDIDAPIFKDLLLYIYCEVVSVNVETAPSLVYAARKYMLPKLVKECGECLADGLDVNNVIQVLETSFIIEDTDLESSCLQLIYHEAKAVLTGPDITTASPRTMETILGMNRIPVKEIAIYNTCMSWAEQQHQIQGGPGNKATDEQIREILGHLIYMIRFPIIDATEFAEISDGKNLLTSEEKTSIYYYLTTKIIGSQLMFSTEPRRFGEEVWIERAVVHIPALWQATHDVDAIDFTTNQDILLTGIGLYEGENVVPYDVDVEILQSTKSLFKRKLTVFSTLSATPDKVSMSDPIFIKAGVLYSVAALAHSDIGWVGDRCESVCSKEKITFTFSHNPQSRYTNVTFGQIPRLYFRH